MEGCPHCAEAKRLIKSGKIKCNFNLVDCDKNPSLADKYEIDRAPWAVVNGKKMSFHEAVKYCERKK